MERPESLLIEEKKRLSILIHDLFISNHNVELLIFFITSKHIAGDYTYYNGILKKESMNNSFLFYPTDDSYE